MSKELVPFWEETYRDNSVSTFAITPNPTVKEFEHLLVIGIFYNSSLMYSKMNILMYPNTYMLPIKLWSAE